MTIKEAQSIVGTLSRPSKMPCHGYSIPAKECFVGGKMHNVPNSICSDCYALKGRYMFPNVIDAMYKRFESLTDSRWVETISFLINKKEKSGFFRWHDSGDLQGVWHLEKIVQVARNLPHIQFWLPTREYVDRGDGVTVVQDWIAENGPKSWGGAILQGAIGSFPKNLTVRLSALMFNAKGPESIAKRLKLTFSGAGDEGFDCPASLQKNSCGDCRACWDQKCQTITYKKH